MTLTPVFLGEVATFIRGITFKPEDKVEVGSLDAVVCMRTKNVQDLIDQDDLIAIPPTFVNRQEQYIVEGDILVSTANSWELVGKSCWVPKINYKATAGGFISILRANREKVFPRYLYHWMNSSVTLRNLRYCGRQTTNISNMSFELACALKLPLPPLPEQKRIAAILDKADSIRRKRQEAVRLTEELLRSVFLDMFGDPVTNPKEWDYKQLDAICKKITDGEHLNPSFVEYGFPIVMANNVRSEGVVFDGVKYVSKEDFEKFTKKCRPEQNDLLVVSRGATIGRCTIVDTNRSFCLMGSTILLKTDKGMVLPAYLNWLLQHPAYQAKLYTTSSASAQQAIYLSHIKELTIPIPPLKVQQLFSSVVSESKKVSRRFSLALVETDTLFNSLLQRAFKGEL